MLAVVRLGMLAVPGLGVLEALSVKLEFTKGCHRLPCREIRGYYHGKCSCKVDICLATVVHCAMPCLCHGTSGWRNAWTN
jgi:hypothetical protein